VSLDPHLFANLERRPNPLLDGDSWFRSTFAVTDDKSPPNRAKQRLASKDPQSVIHVDTLLLKSRVSFVINFRP
jgi:hypothetical protein